MYLRGQTRESPSHDMSPVWGRNVRELCSPGARRAPPLVVSRELRVSGVHGYRRQFRACRISCCTLRRVVSLYVAKGLTGLSCAQAYRNSTQHPRGPQAHEGPPQQATYGKRGKRQVARPYGVVGATEHRG